MEINREKTLDLISSNPLFSGLKKETLSSLIENSEALVYPRGKVIRNNDTAFEGIGVLIRGKVSVGRGKAVINSARDGLVFGAAGLFGAKSFSPSEITASTECTVLKIKKTDIKKLIETEAGFAENYIAYLSERIDFLTERIETLSEGSADEKLEAFIMSSGGSIDAGNMSLLAKKLDIGRASLYRALSALEESGKIKRTDKKIILLK